MMSGSSLKGKQQITSTPAKKSKMPSLEFSEIISNSIDAQQLKNILQLDDRTKPSPSTLENSSNLLMIVAMALAIQWFAGPYTAIAARKIYTELFETLLGGYQWYDPRYYTNFIPAREHIGHLGYQYGPALINAIIIPISYKLIPNAIQTLKSFWGYIFNGSTIEEDESSDVDMEEVENDMNNLCEQLDSCSLDESTPSSDVFSCSDEQHPPPPITHSFQQKRRRLVQEVTEYPPIDTAYPCQKSAANRCR